MTKPRKELVELDSTPFYHCYVRCVRRAYLCGDDRATGENFDHRKQWLVSRIRFLSYVFSIDVCAYAILSNHYHVVLHVDKARAESWSDKEVAERWLQLYNGNVLVNRWLLKPESLGNAELEKVKESIEEWRKRLYDIGWFMRGVNETIARMANEEDRVKGRFWEGRFKSQALLDMAAVLSCMAYVDLNPVRAAIEKDVMTSDFTSIQNRLYEFVKRKPIKKPEEKVLCQRVKHQKKLKNDIGQGKTPEAPLMPFHGSSHTDIHVALPFTKEDYFELVDRTGRAIREDKSGYIPNSVRPLIASVGINPDKWLEHIQKFSRTYSYCVGSSDNIIEFSNIFKRRWAKGVGRRKSAYAA